MIEVALGADQKNVTLQALWMALMVLSSVAKRRRKRRSIVGPRYHQEEQSSEPRYLQEQQRFEPTEEDQRIMEGTWASGQYS